MSDRFDALVIRGTAKVSPPAPATGVVLVRPELSRVHAAVLAALDQALALVESADNLPPAARALLTVVRSTRGMAVDAVERLPEDNLRAMLTALRDQIDAALAPDA